MDPGSIPGTSTKAALLRLSDRHWIGGRDGRGSPVVV
jgi:hypothetical protein